MRSKRNSKIGIEKDKNIKLEKRIDLEDEKKNCMKVEKNAKKGKIKKQTGNLEEESQRTKDQDVSWENEDNENVAFKQQDFDEWWWTEFLKWDQNTHFCAEK